MWPPERQPVSIAQRLAQRPAFRLRRCAFRVAIGQPGPHRRDRRRHRPARCQRHFPPGASPSRAVAPRRRRRRPVRLNRISRRRARVADTTMLFLRNPTQGLDLKKKCAWCYGHSLRCSSIPVCPRGRARGSNPGFFVGFESFIQSGRILCWPKFLGGCDGEFLDSSVEEVFRVAEEA